MCRRGREEETGEKLSAVAVVAEEVKVQQEAPESLTEGVNEQTEEE